MSDRDLLAQRLETHRDHLLAVALRMLGSSHEADDAVQEAWLRLSRADADAVANLGGWLTTVVARVCLDMLRARATKREVPPDAAPGPVAVTSPEDEALLADSIGRALLVVLDTLAPAERLVFVLHDMFAVPFKEIAPIVGRTPSRRPAAGQPSPAAGAVGPGYPRRVRRDPARGGRRVPRCLAPGRLRWAAAAAGPARGAAGRPIVVGFGAAAEVRGPDGVAQTFAGRAQAARLTLVDGLAGAVWSVGGRSRVVFRFTVRGGRVVSIELLGDSETLDILDLEPVRE